MILIFLFLPFGFRRWVITIWQNNRFDRWQFISIFFSELEIAFVVRRNRHHRAVAVAPQYIVGNPYFQLVAVERVDDVAAGRHAFFLHRRHIGFGNRAGFAFGDKCLQFGFVGGCGGCQRMLGGNGNISRAHQRVRAGGINLQEFRVIAFQTLFAVV